jgi:hypothetical protein
MVYHTVSVRLPSPNASPFIKLAHPMEDLLREIPVVNGMDIKRLLVFLQNIFDLTKRSISKMAIFLQ